MSHPPLPVPTAYSRPLGGLESFFTVLSESLLPPSREHWIISTAFKLRFPESIGDPVPYLARAWQALLTQHQALGATLVPPSATDLETRTRIKGGSYDRDSWINESFTTCNDKDATALFSRLCPTATATCHWLPASCEVVLRSSHWRMDGIGMIKLGHIFLYNLSVALEFPTDTAYDAHLSQLPCFPIGPNLEALAQTQTKILSTTVKDDILEAGADALVGEFLCGVPSIGLPTKTGSGEALPSNSSRASIRLNADITAKLVDGCRARNLKVTSAAHAAIVRVTALFPQHPLSKSYAAFLPVDLRRTIDKLVGPEDNHNSRVTGLYFTGIPACVEGVLDSNGAPRKGFDTVARELNTVYARDLVRFWGPLDNSGRTVSLLDLAEPYVRRTTALLSAPVPEGFPPAQTPDLSSLGKLGAYIQESYGIGNEKDGPMVEVVDCWLGTEMLTRNVQFHVWSWKGELSLAACFNKSFYEESFVVDVLEKVKRELLSGCGVEAF
ncbi:hypothetical protein GGS26DRAFT_29936 [Hypomontagnella submonticulosa]|nr:hypothetical protein GGS26DRAFT_29936 [Hypomontagnella submonticulosa]